MLPSFSYLLLAKKKRHFKLTISIYIPGAACHIPKHSYIGTKYICTRHRIQIRNVLPAKILFSICFNLPDVVQHCNTTTMFMRLCSIGTRLMPSCKTTYMQYTHTHTPKHYPANFLEQNKHVSQSRFNFPVCDDVDVMVASTEFSSFTHSTTLNT